MALDAMARRGEDVPGFHVSRNRTGTCNGVRVDDYKFTGICACARRQSISKIRDSVWLGMPLPTMCKSMDVVLATGTPEVIARSIVLRAIERAMTGPDLVQQSTRAAVPDTSDHANTFFCRAPGD